MKINKNNRIYLWVILSIMTVIGFYFAWKYIKKEGFDNTVNYLDGIDVIYWINLDRSTDRRDKMELMLKDEVFNGIPTERISAYDGKTNAKGVFDKFILQKKTMTDTEYGCLLSHLETIRKFDESDYNIALILEDDATLEFKQYWNKTVVSIMKDAPSDWDIIQLSYTSFNKHTDYDYYTKSKNSAYGTVAYIINKRGSKKIMKLTIQNKYIHNNTDGPADWYLYDKTNAYFYKYPMITYATDESTIHNSHLQNQIKAKNITIDILNNQA